MPVLCTIILLSICVSFRSVPALQTGSRLIRGVPLSLEVWHAVTGTLTRSGEMAVVGIECVHLARLHGCHELVNGDSSPNCLATFMVAIAVVLVGLTLICQLDCTYAARTRT